MATSGAKFVIFPSALVAFAIAEGTAPTFGRGRLQGLGGRGRKIAKSVTGSLPAPTAAQAWQSHGEDRGTHGRQPKTNFKPDLHEMLDQFQNTDFSEIAKSMYGEDGTLNDIMKKQFSNLNMTQMLMDMPWLQESNRAEVRCDKMPLCPEGKVAVQNSKKFDVPVLDLDAIVIKLTDELMEHEGVSDEIVPDYVHNLLLDMNPGWQQCLDQAEIDLRVVNGDFTKWDSTVHTIMSEYSSCNLAVCEDFCGPNTGNEHLLKGCKAGVNILMEDLHTNHHSTVHAEHEDIINPNAEFSCANFRFWQMKHSECVTYDKVKDTFYNSLTSFAANAGFAGKSAQLQEVTRIAHQVCAAQNMSFVDMETSADLRAKIVHGFFAEHHQHDQDLHMDRVDHLAIVGDKWEHFKDTIHSFLFPESAMDKTLKDISNGGLDEHLKSLMGDDSNLGDMMQNIGNLFGGGGNGNNMADMGGNLNKMMENMFGSGEGQKMDMSKMMENMWGQSKEGFAAEEF